MAELSTQDLHRLRETIPLYNFSHVECPDCRAKMKLLIGPYGRFYGCERFPETRCPGGAAAADDGSLRAIPIHKEGRAWRKRVLNLIVAMPKAEADSKVITFLRRTGRQVFAIGTMDIEECRVFIDLVHPPSVWDRLADL